LQETQEVTLNSKAQGSQPLGFFYACATVPNARWFHCILTNYGAWLPGDPRGFRTRHHREHVEGDYKNPPPSGIHTDRFQRSKDLQTFPEVILKPAERKLLGEACVEHLRAREIEVLAIAIGAQHTHLQLKREPHRVIATLGHLKRALWYARRNSGNSD
jgi:hypothetical protein